MILYRAVRGYGSVEQAIRELRDMLAVLEDPEHGKQLYAQFPIDKLLKGVAELPPGPRVVVTAEEDETGRLIIHATEDEPEEV